MKGHNKLRIPRKERVVCNEPEKEIPSSEKMLVYPSTDLRGVFDVPTLCSKTEEEIPSPVKMLVYRVQTFVELSQYFGLVPRSSYPIRMSRIYRITGIHAPLNPLYSLFNGNQSQARLASLPEDMH